MDWANERYVRLFIRDTVTWRRWSWQARAIFCLLLRKVDRAGVLDTGRDDKAEALALILDVPIDVAGVVLDEWVTSGTVVVRDTAISIPNFMVAQETSQSDRMRQQQSRDRKRLANIQNSEDARHSLSQPVTDGHKSSLQPSQTRPAQPDPDQTSPSQPIAGAHPKKSRAPSRQEFLYESLFLLGRKVAAGADCPPDESHSPAFINKAINAWLQLWPDTPLPEATIKLLADAGADLRTVAESRLEQLFNAYFEATWPADCKRREGKRDTDDPQPYPFRVLTSEKVWGELVAQLWPDDAYALAWPARKAQLWPEKARGAA